ncbi:MAG: M28 family peptidase [Pirellulales bacterium]
MNEQALLAPAAIHELPGALAPLREQVLADLVMLAQIPAPTGDEEQRVRYMLDRFVEAGLPEAGPDERGNAVGLLPGRRGERTIMLAAHLDTIYPRTVNHNVTVEPDRVLGPGVADNALGAAALSIIPACLARLGIQLDSSLVLLGSVQSLGRSNHEGLRFFLDHPPRPIDYGIVVEGIQLGRANYLSIGKIRGDIVCDVCSEKLRSDGSHNALVVLNQVINRILGIAVPTRPYTKIRLAKMHGGLSYDSEPDHAELGFEVVSHSDEMIEEIRRGMADAVAEMAAQHGVVAQLDCFFRRDTGGIPFSHPLVKTVLEVMSQLGIEPDLGRGPSELPEFICRKIPAMTLGISCGEKNQENEPVYVLIEPVVRGVAQLLGVILEIDRGACDAS